MNQQQVLDLYMVLGGVPHYLRHLDKSLSVAQNIDALCFRKDGLLFHEFDRLFASLFAHGEVHEQIIRAIAKKKEGITREELLHTLKQKGGGTFNKRLGELESAGFIEKFIPFGKSNKYYSVKIIDEYTLFFLSWIDPLKRKGALRGNKNYWLVSSQDPRRNVWSGYAFEAICLKHVNQIIRALGLESVAKEIGSWRYVPKKGTKQEGAQIDLLITRIDKAVTLCEIKYSNSKISITKQYARELAKKVQVFDSHFKDIGEVFLSFVTTKGLKRNLWSEDLVDTEVTLSELFQVE